MTRDSVEDPIPGWQAFQINASDSTLSKSAFLLLLVFRLTKGRPDATWDGDELNEAYSRLEVPQMKPLTRPMERAIVLDRLRRSVVAAKSIQGKLDPTFGIDTLAKLVRDLYTDTGPLAAAVLMEACLLDSDPLVRVVSAISLSRIYAEQSLFVSEIEHAVNEEDELTQQVGLTALNRMKANQNQIPVDSAVEFEKDTKKECTTSLLVHGTFPRELNPSWWQPSGDFHSYIESNVCTDLFGGNNYYKWSGTYSHQAREQAAKRLQDWSNQNGKLNHVFAHSHGANVAMLASQEGLEMQKLVAMSCPFYDDYMPDFANVKDVVSIRVRFDIVVMIDRLLSGGRANPRCSDIKDIRLNEWFNHFRTREPDAWKKHQIAYKI